MSATPCSETDRASCSPVVLSNTCSTATTALGKGRPPRHRQARNDLARLEQQIARLDERLTALHEDMAAAASDYQRLNELHREIELITANKDQLEVAWLQAADIAG